MAYFGNDQGEITSVKDAAKNLKVYQFETRCETDRQPSKQEQEWLHQLDLLEYERTLDRVCDNLLRASKPDPNEGLINLYAERTRKKKFVEVDADCPKDGDFRSLNLYEERVNK